MIVKPNPDGTWGVYRGPRGKVALPVRLPRTLKLGGGLTSATAPRNRSPNTGPNSYSESAPEDNSNDQQNRNARHRALRGVR